jgi:hypothetical protein
MASYASWGFVCLMAIAAGCSASADGNPDGEGTGGASADGVAGVGGVEPGAGGGVTPSAGAGGTSVGAGGHAGSGGSGVGAGGAAGNGGAGGSPDFGGSAGAAGAGGSGGAPHPILPCSAGDGPIDNWENITFDAIQKDGPQAVVVDPKNGANVWVGGNHVGIFKSTDCGGSWTKVNTGKLASDIDSGANWNMQIDPNDGTLYTIVGYGTNHPYRSTNGGVDWEDLFSKGSPILDVAGFAQEMSLDPTNPKHLAVSFHENCKSPNPPSCLGESNDGGTTWNVVKGPASGWVEGASPIILGGKSWLLSTGAGVWRTPDAGVSWIKIADWGAHQAFHAKDGTWYVGSVDVLTSKDGVSWSHIPMSWRNVGIAGDGIRIFGSDQWPGDGQPYHVASESDPTKWSIMTSPKMNDGGDHLVYDPDHHLLYSTNHAAGLWRMRTR